MRDLRDYQIREWLEDGLLTRADNYVETARVSIRRSVHALAVGVVAAGVFFSNVPSGSTEATWQAPAWQEAKNDIPSAVNRVAAFDSSIEARLAQFDALQPTPHEAALLDKARIALEALNTRNRAVA